MCEIVFSVDVCIYSITFVLFWLSWKYLCFLIVMLIVIYFIGLVIISVYVKCFNIDVRIYGTLLILAFFVILILMYAFIVLVPFWLSSRFWCTAPWACKFLRGIALYKSYYYYCCQWRSGCQSQFDSRHTCCQSKSCLLSNNENTRRITGAGLEVCALTYMRHGNCWWKCQRIVHRGKKIRGTKRKESTSFSSAPVKHLERVDVWLSPILVT